MSSSELEFAERNTRNGRRSVSGQNGTHKRDPPPAAWITGPSIVIASDLQDNASLCRLSSAT
jgi:hypothetical protein